MTKNFEDHLSDLEKTVKELESSQLPLEVALSKFEEGIKLVANCQAKLQEAEQKVKMLVGEGASETLKDFDEE